MLKQDAADRRFWRPHRIKMAAAVVVLLIVGFIQALIAVHLLAKRDAAIAPIPCGELVANCPPLKSGTSQ